MNFDLPSSSSRTGEDRSSLLARTKFEREQRQHAAKVAVHVKIIQRYWRKSLSIKKVQQ
jgi:hypothetical protein